MRFLIGLLAALMLLTSIGVGGMAHASEPIGCMDSAVGAVATHADCGMTDVPADADRGYPHHHGACHGHHVAAPANTPPSASRSTTAAILAVADARRLTGIITAIAQEPPKA